MSVAPADLRRRHQLSYAARQLIGEATSAIEDARDLLLAFATMEMRYRQPPYAAWVALPTDPAQLALALERCRSLIDSL